MSVLSMSEGIVLATAPQWQAGSALRGGVYIWIYNPRQDLLYYYAHNHQAFVKPGDLVKPGTRIALLGRTGLNAYKKRSPTHLHLMALQVKPRGELIPVDLYPALKAARRSGV
ncbi:MAG: M23 family metallopeptidase [Adhaeribacter sp.]